MTAAVTNGTTADDRTHDWLHSNDLENLFVFVDVPDKSDVRRAYIVIEDDSEDATAQFALDYRDFESDKIPEEVLAKYYLGSLPKHLRRTEDAAQLDIHVVISIASGTRRAYQFFHLVLRQVLTAIGLGDGSYQIYHTSSPESVTQYTEEVIFPAANAGLRQTVILLSGDGGIFDIINVMLRKPHSEQYVKPVIGLLPLGTGNALANSSGINKDNTKGFLSFMKGYPKPVPVFAATFSNESKYLVNEGKDLESIPTNDNGNPVVYGGMVCSWGLHASLVADSDTEEYRPFGAQRFTMAARELLNPADGSGPHRYRGKVTVKNSNRVFGEMSMSLKAKDGSDLKEHSYILATMVSNLEKTLTISPSSKPLDGQMRLLHWAPVSAEDVMKILGAAFDGGKHVADERVYYNAIEGVRIDMEEEDARWRRICVDGKIVQVEKAGWVEVSTEHRWCIDLVA